MLNCNKNNSAVHGYAVGCTFMTVRPSFLNSPIILASKEILTIVLISINIHQAFEVFRCVLHLLALPSCLLIMSYDFITSLR